MTTFIDYIGSLIIFGIISLTITRTYYNVSSSQSEMGLMAASQESAVILARQIEFDFTKIGYRVASNRILFASTSELRFRSDLENNGTVRTIIYQKGTIAQAGETENPNDFPLIRTVGGTTFTQQWGLTSFNMKYYDSLQNLMGNTITSTDSLRRIRMIQVDFKLETLLPTAVTETDTFYSAIVWEKLIIPRNLSR